MIEMWKEIDGYDGRYQISNYGRIKSFAQDRKNGKVKMGNKTAKGYLSYLLYDGNGNKNWIPVHRLVAHAFVENPNGYQQVNHKDEDKANNRADNLEWCTAEYNTRYGTRTERAARSNRCCKSTSFKVASVDADGNITIYDSIGEAERLTGCSHANIVRTLKGRSHTCGGRKWKYC